MVRAFTLASWNVEHFKDDPARIARVVSFLRDQAPDVFALYEVEGAAVFSTLTKEMPGYSFHITEGPQIQEILVGVRRPLTSFFTQRTEFRSGQTTLRPGALLSLVIEGETYSILFLHTKSGPDPKGLGVRDDQFSRALDFKKTLDKLARKGGKAAASYIFLGDLNTMGMKYPYGRSIDAATEVRKLDREAKRVGMRRLSKDEPATWWNGPGGKFAPSDLDHVVASSHLRFKSQGGAEISVLGWPKEREPAAQGSWIENYSDHGLLRLEVERS
ncbi:MAG: hypothetical protein HMLKMBBP_01252 [Planctomycetes bacterium]|nr:hypothetical protein [Planctomycetota bacterium]